MREPFERWTKLRHRRLIGACCFRGSQQLGPTRGTTGKVA